MKNGKKEEIDQILKLEIDPSFIRRARIIFENLELSGREKVLEVGCGRGFYLKTLKSIWPNLEITGVDLNQRYLKIAKEFIGDLGENLRVNLRVADATKLPFPNNSFDRIIASEVLEHIPDDQKAISEMFRVLRPGGIATITVPNRDYPFLWDPVNWILERTIKWHLPSNIWWLSGIWADHVRLYDEREIREKLGGGGFKIEKTWRATHYCFPFSHFLFYGIGKNIVEKGFLTGFNRFKTEKERSLANKCLLFLPRWIDQKNEIGKSEKSSVNIVIQAKK